MLAAGLAAAGFAVGAFVAVALGAAGLAVAGFAVGAFVAVALGVAGFAAGAFFTGAGAASPDGAAAGFLAPGIGFLVPIGVRFAGGGLVLVVAEGALGVAVFAESKLADGPFFATGAGPFLGVGAIAGFPSVGAFAAGAFAGAFAGAGAFLTGAEEANFFGAGLPVALPSVELTVSLYP